MEDTRTNITIKTKKSNSNYIHKDCGKSITKKECSCNNIIVNPKKFTENEYVLYTKYSHKSKFNSPEEEYEYAIKNEKTCSKCGIMKKLIEYNGNTSGSDPFDKNGYRLRRPECKDCTKDALEGKNIAKRLAKQQGIPYKAPEGTICQLCRKGPKKGDGLVFDHCHETKTFRGYLHNSCNRSIGVLGDTVEKLLNVINYLNNGKKFIQDEDSGELRIKE